MRFPFVTNRYLILQSRNSPFLSTGKAATGLYGARFFAIPLRIFHKTSFISQ